jgi:ATP-dependent Lhr-like helicase
MISGIVAGETALMNADVNELLQSHQSLRARMPHAWTAFFGGFGNLRPVQLAAMPLVLSGKSALVTAPTAGGKTEAAMAPLCERLSHHRWEGLSILVITPTRALVNDLFARLSRPLGQMGIRLGRKTADHGLGEDITEQVVITTPESTDSLLMRRRERLHQVQALVLDEIHLLDGSPRGDQLRAVMSRLSAFRSHVDGRRFRGLQRVAMSATVSDPRRVANCYAGDGSEIISIGGRRELEAKVIVAKGTIRDRAEAAIAAVDSFEEVRKILVFVNSRHQVDQGAEYFQYGRFSKVPVYGHHGSLSKFSREEAEARFKSDSQAICVATMTLEVGIDIGDIDLVICMDPPFSLSSFLQRIGRGCRRLSGRTRVLCVARDRAGELIFEGLIRQAEVGLPRGPTAPFRRSVLLQQILAYLRQVPRHRRALHQFIGVFSSSADPRVERAVIEEVVRDMAQTGLLDKQGQVYQPAKSGWDFIESNRIFTNIQANPLEIALVDVDTGKPVASVAGLGGSASGIRVAGRSYEVLPGGSAMVRRVRSGGSHLDGPSYYARPLPYAFDVAKSLAAKFGIGSEVLVAMRIGNGYLVFTWLGRLLNAILAAGLRRRGYEVAEGSFHLALTVRANENLIELLKVTVTDVISNNPLVDLPVNRFVDLGPHHRYLSPSMQRKACEDWLDSSFLTEWSNGLSRTEIVEEDSSLGADLLALI